ncbi:ABC-three component system middle component 5 [Burkholderia sp. SCN-KJ]|uniref:ABC-three component system middle component 5 n=1 Tax=Burkholderia sp. SCN-KJ TaxID=2969248 RepID=UPI0021502A2C|nr:ABC-three component system middle component 5 [Burkholderia sp. SCN-KJ]MCR4469739.1 hypothetical protein [Burkholderia sp. SCN-KJ]
MLIYHPAFDGYHCVFRMLLIAERVSNLEIEKARILDFYLVFPGMVKSIRLPENLRELRAQAKAATNIYRDPVNSASTFMEMRHIQEEALRSIAASGLIDMEPFAAGYVVRTGTPLPKSLDAKLKEFVEANQPIAEGVLAGLSRIPLLGQNGLKDRSQLMEHRYDLA